MPQYSKTQRMLSAKKRQANRVKKRAKRATHKAQGKGYVTDPLAARKRTGELKVLARLHTALGRALAVNPSKVRANVNAKQLRIAARQYQKYANTKKTKKTKRKIKK